MRKPDAGGGWHALRYTFRVGRRVGFLALWRAMRRRNACKTCALGMGGQQGGMRNELGRFPEVCKKSLQAMAADMQGEVQETFFSTYSLAQMQGMSPRELETAGRLVTPLYAGPGDTHYRKITWEEATRRLVDKMRATAPEQAFFYFSGRSSNEAAFLLQLFARLYGTNHVNNCSYYCHQASGVGLQTAIGSGTATVEAKDVEAADLFFLIGGNPASNHPRLMTHLMHLRRRGGHVIVVNPVRETGLVKFRIPSDPRSLFFGTEIASEYVQINAGGDVAYLMGIAKALLARGAVDFAFIGAATEGWDEVRAVVERTSWEEVEAAAGIGRTDIERVAALYARSRKVIFSWAMGITHHLHGVENVQWIANLALMRGMIGRPHAGLLPIRGHSNIQGVGSVGVTPALKQAIFERFVAAGIKVPEHAGLDTMGCLDAAHAGRMRLGWSLGGNLYGASPDSCYASEALSRLDMLVYLNTSLNTGHAHGRAKETLILPVLARDEEPYLTTQESMFNYVRLSDGGPSRHAGPRGEVEIVADVAGQVLGTGGPVDWLELRDTGNIRQLIARLVPGFAALANIDRSRKEFQIPGRVLHERRFPTASGRARFHAHPIPARIAAPDRFVLMTVRSEGQFNTVVFEDHDLYRGQDRRDVVLMHPDDLARLGLGVGALVTVMNDTGRMHVRARPFDVKPGHVVMYYPEANALVPRALDPRSKTPAFKATWVKVSATAANPL